MKITDIRLAQISIPLHTPFKTAIRTVTHLKDFIVEVHTDAGLIGYGEAAPTGLITGDTQGALMGAFKEHIIPAMVGEEIDLIQPLLKKLHKCVKGNSSAKAAMDIALWDLYGQMLNVPVYKLLGGTRREITTDITISVNDPDEMARDTQIALDRGYDTLKVKVGVNPKLDLERLRAIRSVAKHETLRIDANQAWQPKEAVKMLTQMEREGLNIELVEQPVPAHDLAGLAYVTERSPIPVLADEAVFSPLDASNIIAQKAADMVNIKLMKCGGLYQGLHIASAAEVAGIECMIGCMLEAKISVNAAVHFACARDIITKIDLDGPILCSEDPIEGGSIFNEKTITVSDDPGFGIKAVHGLTYLD